jgi:polyphosphate kinase
VEIDLIVRGVCSLRPGVPGVSETIRVRSIIGRFLEHSRIYYFRNGGEEVVYAGSADLMPRNLNRRVEVLFPIESQRIVRRIRDKILAKYLADEACSHIMQPDGQYLHPKRRPGKQPVNAQDWFLKHEA